MQEHHQTRLVIGSCSGYNLHATFLEHFFGISIRQRSKVRTCQGFIGLTFGQQPDLTSDFVGSSHRIARHDNDFDVRPVHTDINRLAHIRTDRVGNTHQTHKRIVDGKTQCPISLALIIFQGGQNPLLCQTLGQFATHLQNDFGGTLQINRIVHLCQHILCFRTERLLSYNRSRLPEGTVIQLPAPDPLQQSTLRRISDSLIAIQFRRTVNGNTAGYFFSRYIRTEQTFNHRHPVLGKRAGFVGTDNRSSTHRFAGMQFADQIVFLQHLSHTESQADRNAHRQTLGNSHHNQGDGNHNGTQDNMNNRHRILPFRLRNIEEKVHQTTDNNQNGNYETGIRNPLTQHIQLPAQGGLDFFPFLHTCGTAPLFGIHSNGNHFILCATLYDRRTPQKKIFRISRFLVRRHL